MVEESEVSLECGTDKGLLKVIKGAARVTQAGEFTEITEGNEFEIVPVAAPIAAATEAGDPTGFADDGTEGIPPVDSRSVEASQSQ